MSNQRRVTEVIFSTVFLLCSSLTALGQQTPTNLFSVVAGNNRLCASVQAAQMKKQPRSFIFSPLGTTNALTVMLPGAGGKTAKEIEAVLGLPEGYSLDRVITATQALQKCLGTLQLPSLGIDILEDKKGLVVVKVAENSIAAKLRIQAKEVIVSVNRTAVKSLVDFDVALANAKDIVEFELLSSEGTSRHVSVFFTNATGQPLANSTAGYRLLKSSGFWASHDLQVEQAFLQHLTRLSPLGVQRTDFTKSEASRQLINEWIERTTQGEIRDCLRPSDITEETKLVLR